jgi:hypothetical protein
MGKRTEIKLATAIKGHGGPITTVIVREPTFSEYLQYGDPIIWVPLPSGGAFPSENLDVVSAYMRICVVEPDALLIEQGGLDLARKLKDAILGFFLPVSEEAAGSTTSPTS